jgi:hypothetical protein
MRAPEPGGGAARPGEFVDLSFDLFYIEPPVPGTTGVDLMPAYPPVPVGFD